MLKEKQQNMKHIPSVWVGREAVGPMGGHNGRTVAPEAILFESPCTAHSET